MPPLYPLPMRFPVPINGSENAKAGRPLERDDYIDVMIRRTGWDFLANADVAVFAAQPVADRLSYRRAFEAQVQLAKETPA